MVRRLLMMFVGGLAAAMASQAPEFAQQYAQRLGGAIDELKLVVSHFDQDAAKAGMDRAAGLRRLETTNDQFVADRGNSMRKTIDRLDALQKQRDAMQAPDVLTRVGAMVAQFDGPIARKAAAQFKPAIPLNAEGLFFSLLGLLAGVFSVGLLMIPFRRQSVFRDRSPS